MVILLLGGWQETFFGQSAELSEIELIRHLAAKMKLFFLLVYGVDMSKRRSFWVTTSVVLLVGFALGAGFRVGPAMGGETVDPDADRILQSMSTYLGALTKFSATADVDSEIIDMNGQKLQLSSSASVLVERPNKLYATRRGPVADVEVLFDGKVVTIHGKGLDVYAQFDSPGTIDDAIATLGFETGLDAPGADLLYADSYAGLTSNVTSGAYLGTAYVNGVECHHLAYRAPKVDWQIWVQAGEKPLPMKYVITSKWVAGAPEYALRFRNWDTQPKIDSAKFQFTVPEGARKLDEVHVNEIGELAVEGVK